ncbi:MAG: hypothetical protein ACR2JY_08275 [Chloroflexota bacterium]
MAALSTARKAGGRILAGAGLVIGLGAGVVAGSVVPTMPWLALLVASTFTFAICSAGFVWSGEVFTASCPCCQARTVATTWRQTFQCRRCQTMCALAALSGRRHLRRLPAGRLS